MLRQPAPFTVTIHRQRGRVRLVAITGELDVAAGIRLADVVAGIPAGRIVRLDLTGVRFCDCAGYAAFLRAARSLDARGTLAVSELPVCVRRIGVLGNGLVTRGS